jgi:hypothetical protein
MYMNSATIGMVHTRQNHKPIRKDLVQHLMVIEAAAEDVGKNKTKAMMHRIVALLIEDMILKEMSVLACVL